MNVFLLTLIFSGFGLSAIIIGNYPRLAGISQEKLKETGTIPGRSLGLFLLRTIIFPMIVFYQTKARFWIYRFSEGMLNKFRFIILKLEKFLYLFSRYLKKKRSLENNNAGSEYLRKMNEWKNDSKNNNLPA